MSKNSEIFKFKMLKAANCFTLKELSQLIDEFPNLKHLKRAFELREEKLKGVKNASKK
ncbi:hypothetical protein [Campylobacter ureolyticus]|uniref:hypothetical protein n=1 Tax=Campylobacter ureolyticus TaxID=827 RepID=UPI001FC7CBFE|nr:hypothetical protein [Campylobacter ureolyticus]MCZ6105714.1 hypothetical protein [Campylobacter ureolyticus]MCZ6110851.1 hypothetical protein [Campylobacter ureolyticus]MDK8323813.1 hypothetical protein [Campylobacter ureolyticus]GKH60800.1 hypothetical protein CE91St25_11360 [Campylobacter ureolyticus]